MLLPWADTGTSRRGSGGADSSVALWPCLSQDAACTVTMP